jgi:hypothetical protein
MTLTQTPVPLTTIQGIEGLDPCGQAADPGRRRRGASDPEADQGYIGPAQEAQASQFSRASVGPAARVDRPPPARPTACGLGAKALVRNGLRSAFSIFAGQKRTRSCNQAGDQASGTRPGAVNSPPGASTLARIVIEK